MGSECLSRWWDRWSRVNAACYLPGLLCLLLRCRTLLHLRNNRLVARILAQRLPDLCIFREGVGVIESMIHAVLQEGESLLWLSLLNLHHSQLVPKFGNVGVILAEDLALFFKHLGVKRLGFRVAFLRVKNIGEIAHACQGVRMIRSQKFLARGENLTMKFLRLDKPVLLRI